MTESVEPIHPIPGPRLSAHCSRDLFSVDSGDIVFPAADTLNSWDSCTCSTVIALNRGSLLRRLVSRIPLSSILVITPIPVGILRSSRNMVTGRALGASRIPHSLELASICSRFSSTFVSHLMTMEVFHVLDLASGTLEVPPPGWHLGASISPQSFDRGATRFVFKFPGSSLPHLLRLRIMMHDT